MDQFILKSHLKWIPYNKFKNVEYLNKGGFGTIYKAIWLDKENKEVALKCLNNINNENLNEFLNEVCIIMHYIFLNFNYNIFKLTLFNFIFYSGNIIANV